MGGNNTIKIECTEEQWKTIVICERSHTVVEGVYAFSIAKKYNMTPEELKQCNKDNKKVLPNGVNGDFVLHEGDVLNVKGKVISKRVVKGGDILPKEDSCPPWVEIARKELTTKESRDITEIDPKIAEYYKASNYHPQIDDSSDKDPWCGAFLAWVMTKAGYTPPNNSIGAKYWLNFGEDDDDFHCGTIIIKGRDGGNHVSMAVGQDKSGKWIYALGGNQNNSVCVKIYPREVWYSMRFPKGYKGKKSPLPIINTTPQKFQEEILKKIREK